MFQQKPSSNEGFPATTDSKTGATPPAGKTPTSNAKNFLYFVASALVLVALYYLAK
jgi:hypothetical protein